MASLGSATTSTRSSRRSAANGKGLPTGHCVSVRCTSSTDCTGALALYRAHVPTAMMDPDHFALVEAACWERKGELARALPIYHACGGKEPRCRAAEERLTRDPAARSSEKPL